MSTARRLLGLVSAAAVITTLVPAPAHAAVPPDPNAVLVAGPAPQVFPGRPDKRIYETMEVRNDSDKPLRVVLHVKTQGLWMAGAHTTCRYTNTMGPGQIPDAVEEAVCQPPNEILPGRSYKYGSEMIRVHPQAQPGAVYSYTFTWYTREYADAQGPAFLGRDKMTGGLQRRALDGRGDPRDALHGQQLQLGQGRHPRRPESHPDRDGHAHRDGYPGGYADHHDGADHHSGRPGS